MPTAAGFTGQVMISSAPGKALQPTVYTFPATSGLAGQVLRLHRYGCRWANVGTGDVIGPATSGSDTLAVFADTTGKLIKSCSFTIFKYCNRTRKFCCCQQGCFIYRAGE